MKNNKIYKYLFAFSKLLEIIVPLVLVRMFVLPKLFAIYSRDGRDIPRMIEFLTGSFISIFFAILFILGIYVLIYRAFTNLIYKKKYSKKWFHILLKVLSSFVVVGVVIALIVYFMYSIVVGYSTFNDYSWFESIIAILISIIPLSSILAFSKLYNLKYEIKDKKYIIATIVSTLYVIFACIMMTIEVQIYFNYANLFIIFIVSALVMIFLFNIYTLLVVRETNKENNVGEKVQKQKLKRNNN